MNFSVLDGYFDTFSSSEDTDTSNQGYKPPITKPIENQLLSQFIENENKDIATLRSESDKVRKQLRHLYKLRTSKYKSVTNEISKSYKRMHLHEAQITKQFGQTQLAIINWRILFEQKYLSEIKSLINYFTYNNNNTNNETTCDQKEDENSNSNNNNENEIKDNELNIPHLSEEAPSSGDNEHSLLLPDESESNISNILNENDETKKTENSNDKNEEIKLDELNSNRTKNKNRIKIKSINNSDNSLHQRIDSINRPKSRYSMEKHKRKSYKTRKKYKQDMDINGYLISYRKCLETEMGTEKRELSDLCKNLRLELQNEKYLQQKQELLVSYSERIAIVLLLFHWFIETNKYELKSNIYSQNNICNQLSGQKTKHYYLCIGIVTQIQNKFDCLVLDDRNSIGNNIRKWFKILSHKDIRHLKPSILLKHINCFIRDFIKSYHYIINDIVKNQNNKYNIEYVIKKHESFQYEEEFKQYISHKYFLCKKNQTTEYYYKQQLTSVSLRWTLLRLLQRCIYSRLSIIGILPKLHSLNNSPFDCNINNKNNKKFGIISNYQIKKQNNNLPFKIFSNDGDTFFDDEKYGHLDKKIGKKLGRKKKKPMAMQMVTLDANGKSSVDDDIIESISSEIGASEDLLFNSCISNVSKPKKNNIEYITFPHGNMGNDGGHGDFEEEKETKVIQYGQNQYGSMNNCNLPKHACTPTFSIYGLPRNSDYEFELLDQHFFNQCGWMRNLSVGQLGIEQIYWCNIPPKDLHANSDILINVKSSDPPMHAQQRRNTLSSSNDNQDTAASSLSELNIHVSTNYNKRAKKKKRKKNNNKTLIKSKSGTVTLTKGVAKLKEKEKIINEENDMMNECLYDYTIRPFGDALALIECLDELTAPHDMNECLGYVVDVIFRTAQTYRKFNIRKQIKMERYHLDLSNFVENNNNKNNQDSLTHINGEAAIGADVFFPLFIWVIVHSKIRNIHRSVFIMSHYNDSDAMKTKVGYNVSTLHSALDHIMKANRKLYIKQNFRR